MELTDCEELDGHVLLPPVVGHHVLALPPPAEHRALHLVQHVLPQALPHRRVGQRRPLVAVHEEGVRAVPLLVPCARLPRSRERAPRYRSSFGDRAYDPERL